MVKKCDQIVAFLDHGPFINQQEVTAVYSDTV